MTTSEKAAVFKALSNDNRLEIFMQILKAEKKSFRGDCGCLVAEVISMLRIGAPTVSHHLKELANAGLIETEKEGKYLVARVNRKLLAELQPLFDIGTDEIHGSKTT